MIAALRVALGVYAAGFLLSWIWSVWLAVRTNAARRKTAPPVGGCYVADTLWLYQGADGEWHADAIGCALWPITWLFWLSDRRHA